MIVWGDRYLGLHTRNPGDIKITLDERAPFDGTTYVLVMMWMGKKGSQRCQRPSFWFA